MADVAIGVTVFKRMGKLSQLLDSIDPDAISHVYIADVGDPIAEKDLYQRTFPFETTVFDLEYDAGLGAGRTEIVDNLTEEFLLVIDSDMRMPNDIQPLYEILQSDQSIGGVCGLFIEHDRIYTSCLDIFDEDRVFKLEIREQKDIETVGRHPYVEFDFIANSGLFRKSCLEEYCWDPELIIGREHSDFFVGHKRLTDWKFGLCPSVYFPHYPGGDQDYLSHRWSEDKYEQAELYFLDKWGFQRMERTDYNWLETFDPEYGAHPPYSLTRLARRKYRTEGVLGLLRSGVNILRQRVF